MVYKKGYATKSRLYVFDFVMKVSHLYSLFHRSKISIYIYIYIYIYIIDNKICYCSWIIRRQTLYVRKNIYVFDMKH